jgi:hypothetical protein
LEGERFGRGVKEAVGGVVLGIIIQAFINAFSRMPLIPVQYIFMLQLIQVVGIIADFFIILLAPKFGLGFFSGWVIGMGLMAYAGLIEPWLIVVYIGVAIASGVLRLLLNTSHYD